MKNERGINKENRNKWFTSDSVLNTYVYYLLRKSPKEPHASCYYSLIMFTLQMTPIYRRIWICENINRYGN
jgi:hypothetical protein